MNCKGLDERGSMYNNGIFGYRVHKGIPGVLEYYRVCKGIEDVLEYTRCTIEYTGYIRVCGV